MILHTLNGVFFGLTHFLSKPLSQCFGDFLHLKKKITAIIHVEELFIIIKDIYEVRIGYAVNA